MRRLDLFERNFTVLLLLCDGGADDNGEDSTKCLQEQSRYKQTCFSSWVRVVETFRPRFASSPFTVFMVICDVPRRAAHPLRRLTDSFITSFTNFHQRDIAFAPQTGRIDRWLFPSHILLCVPPPLVCAACCIPLRLFCERFRVISHDVCIFALGALFLPLHTYVCRLLPSYTLSRLLYLIAFSPFIWQLLHAGLGVVCGYIKSLLFEGVTAGSCALLHVQCWVGVCDAIAAVWMLDDVDPAPVQLAHKQ